MIQRENVGKTKNKKKKLSNLMLPLAVAPQNPPSTPLLHPFSPKYAGIFTSGGNIPTTQVQGCNLRFAPTLPLLKILERSITAGVWIAPAQQITIGAENAIFKWLLLGPTRTMTPTACFKRPLSRPSLPFLVFSRMIDSTQAPVIIFVVPVLHESAKNVFTVSCFAPRAHPKQLQKVEKWK
jgi:hypothetical protein